MAALGKEGASAVSEHPTPGWQGIGVPVNLKPIRLGRINLSNARWLPYVPKEPVCHLPRGGSLHVK